MHLRNLHRVDHIMINQSGLIDQQALGRPTGSWVSDPIRFGKQNRFVREVMRRLRILGSQKLGATSREMSEGCRKKRDACRRKDF